MSELAYQGPQEGGGGANTMASSLVGPLEASGSELAAAAFDSLHQRRGSFGVRHGAGVPALSPQTSASDLLLHAQPCSLQGLLGSRTEAATGAATPLPANAAASPSLTSLSGGEGEEKNGAGEQQQQQHILKQDFAFNALGEPLYSQSHSLSKKWNSRESASGSSLVGVDIESHTTTSSSRNSSNSNSSSNGINSCLSNSTGGMWSPFERDAAGSPVLLPFGLAAATNGAAANAAATAAAGKADSTPPSLNSPDAAAAQPRTLRAAVRGGLERLMRFSAWQQREALPSATAAAAATQVLPSSAGLLSWASDASRGPPDLGGPPGVLPQGGGALATPYRPPLAPQGGAVLFGVAHPEARAHVVLLMELQRMRNELAQLHLQQQRQPSIVIQNHTAVAAKAEAPSGQQQEPLRRNWVSDWASTFFASRLNRVLFVCGVGVSCLMLLEHWRHSWRMAQLKVSPLPLPSFPFPLSFAFSLSRSSSSVRLLPSPSLLVLLSFSLHESDGRKLAASRYTDPRGCSWPQALTAATATAAGTAAAAAAAVPELVQVSLLQRRRHMLQLQSMRLVFFWADENYHC
ncbi:hypothetical protein Esti_005140 [Eimeria stiedai]